MIFFGDEYNNIYFREIFTRIFISFYVIIIFQIIYLFVHLYDYLLLILVKGVIDLVENEKSAKFNYNLQN